MIQNLDTKNIQIKFTLHMKSGTPLFVSTKKHLFISGFRLHECLVGGYILISIFYTALVFLER